jgi:antitoxin ParD1/3/4
MTDTQELTITLPTELAQTVQSKVASGEFASESDLLRESLSKFFAPDPDLENWLKTVGVARYDAYDANPNDVFTGDQILQAVAEQLSLRKTG